MINTSELDITNKNRECLRFPVVNNTIEPECINSYFVMEWDF